MHVCVDTAALFTANDATQVLRTLLWQVSTHLLGHSAPVAESTTWRIVCYASDAIKARITDADGPLPSGTHGAGADGDWVLADHSMEIDEEESEKPTTGMRAAEPKLEKVQIGELISLHFFHNKRVQLK